MTLDEILSETKPSQFIYDLIDFATEPNIGGMAPEDLEKAPALIKAAIYLNAFRLATGNSGIWKWFEEMYDDCPNFADFLRQINADHAADYIDAGKSLFPGGIVPEDADERFDYCCVHGQIFRQVDHKFEEASDDAILKFREHIIAHKKFFQLEAESYWNVRKENRRLRRKRNYT
jgi:hypothetical protein